MPFSEINVNKNSKSMSSESLDEAHFLYAMSAPYREMKVADYLKAKEDIKVFLPLERRAAYGGQHSASESFPDRPVVRNLLFVKATPGRMRGSQADLQFHASVQDPVLWMDIRKSSPSPIRKWRISWRSAKTWRMPSHTSREIKLRPEARVRIEDGVFAGL